MAARLRRELNLEVDMVRGRYGEYKVLVDDAVVVDGGPLVILGVMPSPRNVIDTVRERLSRGGPNESPTGGRSDATGS